MTDLKDQWWNLTGEKKDDNFLISNAHSEFRSFGIMSFNGFKLSSNYFIKMFTSENL